MHITETRLDAHLPVTAPAEDHPDRYNYPFDSAIWRTLHGHEPLSTLISALCGYNLYAAANEQRELEISTDETGTRVLDLYTDMAYSPFTRRTERVTIRGWDVVDFVCADPELTVRFNHGSDLEMTFKSTLLRRLGQELLNARLQGGTMHNTVAVGTATNENTGAQS